MTLDLYKVKKDICILSHDNEMIEIPKGSLVQPRDSQHYEIMVFDNVDGRDFDLVRIKNSVIANKEIFEELSVLRNEIFVAGIESIDTGKTVVTQREFIEEWVANVDLEYIDRVKDHIEENRMRWIPPAQTVKCDACGNEDQVTIELDQSNFFGKA